MTPDIRTHAPATERNRDAILAVLREVLALPIDALGQTPVLEIGSGSGEHAVYLASHLAADMPSITWQPTEASAAALGSIRAWIAHTGATNVLEPQVLDVNTTAWPITHARAVIAINVIHYSGPDTTLALLDGAARVLPPGGVLYLYGPYRRNGQHTAASNVEFDAWLKSRNPAFGVRDLDAVRHQAEQRGFELERVVDMPANNLSVVFRRQSAP